MLKWDIRDTDIGKLKDKWISYADEVRTVGEALNGFIQWPKRLLRLVANKDVERNKKDVLPSKRDIMELCMKTQDLRLSILRIWVVYMKHLCTRLEKSDMYGFIDPNFIQPQGDPAGSQSYITEKLIENEKDCFFVPYFNNHHWQLLIIEPKTQNVVFLCSMGLKPDKNIVLVIDSAKDNLSIMKVVTML
ncbi:hypothetical protein P8452_36278 [Trifolium repens]|nr:hypothetical protein P8452_36278 [Trifolium repens]